MARSVAWQRTCSDLVFWRQTEAQNATIYILRETGPTGFLLKEEGVTKPCKAFLGDPHSCTCSQFAKDRDLCKHICWLLLKKFRVPQTNAMSWQKGLVEREINEILRGLNQQQRKKVPSAVSRWRRPTSASSDGKETIPQKEITQDDVCPICQDELLAKRLPVTYCKFGCGNSIHIKCMKVWAEHQKSQGDTVVKCPLCREDFGPFELLKHENHNAVGRTEGGRMDRHIGTDCKSCHMFPIEGKCYRCVTCNFYLCQACFNTPIHTQHAFQYRHKRNQRWRPAGRAYGAVLPQAVMDDLVNREITDNDYELLTQLDGSQAPQGSDIPEEVIQSWPLEKVRENGPLLQPGMQCRVCLRGYQLGQFVRKLPRCKHKFHKDCIDNWLVHSRPTCPIDGQVVWNRATAQMEEDSQANRQRVKKPNNSTTQQAHTVNLEIPGIGLTLRAQESTDPCHPPPHPTHQGSHGRRRPPIGRQGFREDREAQRIMGALQRQQGANFGLSGSAIAGASNHDLGADHGGGHVAHASLPGNRLLNRANNRRAVMNERLDAVGIEYQSEHQLHGQSLAQIEQENIDPLEQVAAANLDHADHSHEYYIDSQEHEPSQQTRQQPQQNHSALFGQMAPDRPDITNTLLNNINRISTYQDNPNIYQDAGGASGEVHNSQQMMLESVRTNQSNEGVGNGAVGTTLSQGQGRPSNEEFHMRIFSDVPAGQRLFSDNGAGQSGSSSTSSSSHLMFNQPNPATENRGHNTHSTRQGRKPKPSNSAPASVNGVFGPSYNFALPLPERGRGGQRTGVHGNTGTGVLRNRSNSKDRGSGGGQRNPSAERYMGQVPKEGEHLLERLQLFSGLYLGNSPRSHPAQSGFGPGTTGGGLPPRPHGRSNQDAARQRRFENQRRKANFTLEGNACADLTLRDLFNT